MSKLKDCKDCVSFKVCRHRIALDKISKENWFYSMFEYLEYNTVSEDLGSVLARKCRYFTKQGNK